MHKKLQQGQGNLSSCRKGMTGGIKDVKEVQNWKDTTYKSEKNMEHIILPPHCQIHIRCIYSQKYPWCGFWYRVKVTHHISAHELGSRSISYICSSNHTLGNPGGNTRTTFCSQLFVQIFEFFISRPLEPPRFCKGP